ncbi:dihydrolipoamide acetyltransferase family protein [Streptomyces sp. 8N616]|uniref:dihydrolipoamide acetyltransferase family protein n=1 Tax=Streptomyces sp. 8N616 TaxID=3457414 RepID=UPI003FD32347
MAVVREFTLPDLGEGLTEAEVVRWLVQVGDVVAVDQPVVEVETAKATVEVPCPYGGVVTARFGEEGTELPVGAPLLTVAVGVDSTASQAEDSAEPAEPAGRPGSAAEEGSGNVLVGYGTGAPAARRRRVRRSGGFSRSATEGEREPRAADVAHAGGGRGGRAGAGAPSGAAGTGPRDRASGGQTVDGLSAVERAAAGQHTAGQPTARQPTGGHSADGWYAGQAGERAGGPVAVISPLVRRIAREHGIDLRAVKGSGPEGLILRADVEEAARRMTVTAAHGEAAPYAAAGTTGPGPVLAGSPAGQPTGEHAGVGGPEREERIPLRGVRGAVADKLSRSRREIPDATCWVDADATELMAARTAMNASGGPQVSLLALLARICTAALARYPELNSTVDTENREIVRLPAVHLGFAAQTERGLVVPVVRDAQARTTVGLTEEIARLTEAARAGALTPAELTGGTFTLNNYGVFGVDGSTPIINHPEAAMLGVGRIVPKPWVHQGELAVRQVVQLSLTFDHRVCDGGTAGGFLRFVADCVEQPAVLLRTV